MATLTLEYNTRNLLAEKTIAYILSLGVFKAKINGLDLAIEQLQEGKTIRCNDFNDYLEKVK
ncbi:MAG: hypothetical protein LBU83_11630 [Bacteroidales bacterium]|jgi:hypothetical protein|nr:hypothetical protein [Bacteroidales bacterium]